MSAGISAMGVALSESGFSLPLPSEECFMILVFVAMVTLVTGLWNVVN